MRLTILRLLLMTIFLGVLALLATPSWANTGGTSSGSFGIGCCGGGDWYWETANINKKPRAVSQISLSSGSGSSWRPSREQGQRAMKNASENVLNRAVVAPCGTTLTGSNCIVWYNQCDHSGATNNTELLRGACQAAYTSMGSREVHEPASSPIEAGAGWRPSGSPSIYNIKVWRQTSSGGWVSMFERRIGISNASTADEADAEADGHHQWFYGRNSRGDNNRNADALFYEAGNRNGNDNRAGPLTPVPDRGARRVCDERASESINRQSGVRSFALDARSKKSGSKAYKSRCYWEGASIGDGPGSSGVFRESDGSLGKFNGDYSNTGAGSETSTREAIGIRWNIANGGSSLRFGIDSPPGYYYIVQIVAMDKREQIMPNRKKTSHTPYPFTRGNCDSSRNRHEVSVAGTAAGKRSYAVSWCGNYIQAYMPNPGEPADVESGQGNSSAELEAPKSIMVGEDAIVGIDLKAENLPFNAAVLPRYARLRHFTPQLAYSSADRLPDETFDRFDLDKTYNNDYIFYDTNPSALDRLSAPPFTDFPPTTGRRYLPVAAQVSKPMELAPGYDGSGLVADSFFKMNWRSPTLENPCSSEIDFPKAVESGGRVEVQAQWPRSPRSCNTDNGDVRTGQDGNITSFNVWDDWLVGLVVREERVLRITDFTPSYGLVNELSMRCGNNGEYDQFEWRPVRGASCQDNSEYKRNTWNALPYTPLADNTVSDPEGRFHNGSMQFAQGYTTLRAPACQDTRIPITSSGTNNPSYCRSPGNWPARVPRPAASRGEAEMSPTTWNNARHNLRWWEYASFHVRADTNRGQSCVEAPAKEACVRSMVAWSRELTKNMGGQQKRILAGSDPLFSSLTGSDGINSSPLGAPVNPDGNYGPSDVGFETSNRAINKPNPISRAWELNFCRQALPQNTRLNQGTSLNPNDDTNTPDFYTDANYGSANCAGWSQKWNWRNVDRADAFNVCTANSRDAPTVPRLSEYNLPSNQPTDGKSRYGDYHTSAPGERSWDPANPGSGEYARGAKFHGAPYRGWRPGTDKPSPNPRGWSRKISTSNPSELSSTLTERYTADCDEDVVGRPDKGYWDSTYSFRKLPDDTSNRTTVASNPTQASVSSNNCKFTLAQANRIIATKTPSKVTGTAAAPTVCKHIYETRWTNPPALWGCVKIGPSSRGRSWNRWNCNYVRGRDTLLAFGFWYRYSTEWKWFKGRDSTVPAEDNAWPSPARSALTCHVGSDMPSSVTRDTNLSSSTVRTGSGDLGGSGPSFAASSELSGASTSHGRGSSDSDLYYSGSSKAWNTQAPNTRGPASSYARQTSNPPQQIDYWSCQYLKKGYIVNNRGAGDWGLAGRWDANDPQSGWGLNNTGPRLYTGTDYNRWNITNANRGRPIQQQKSPNMGSGYMVQMNFDFLDKNDLRNSRSPGWRYPSGTTEGAHADCRPQPDNFFTSRSLDPYNNSSNANPDSVYSGPGTCWRMLATYQGDTSNNWYYGINYDKIDDGTSSGANTSPDSQLQGYIRVGSNRDTR